MCYLNFLSIIQFMSYDFLRHTFHQLFFWQCSNDKVTNDMAPCCLHDSCESKFVLMARGLQLVSVLKTLKTFLILYKRLEIWTRRLLYQQIFTACLYITFIFGKYWSHQNFVLYSISAVTFDFLIWSKEFSMCFLVGC